MLKLLSTSAFGQRFQVQKTKKDTAAGKFYIEFRKEESNRKILLKENKTFWFKTRYSQDDSKKGELVKISIDSLFIKVKEKKEKKIIAYKLSDFTWFSFTDAWRIALTVISPNIIGAMGGMYTTIDLSEEWTAKIIKTK